MGPEVDSFEKELAAVTGRLDCVALSSGTAALHLALLLLKVDPGDKVLVPVPRLPPPSRPSGASAPSRCRLWRAWVCFWRSWSTCSPGSGFFGLTRLGLRRNRVLDVQNGGGARALVT